MRMRFLIGCALIQLNLLLPASAVSEETDHDRARHALMAGKIASLTKVLEKARQLYMGTVLNVELESDEEKVWTGGIDKEHGYREGAGYGRKPGNVSFVYVISLLSPQGNVLRLEFDAKSMELLAVKGRDSESSRRIP